MSVPQVWRRDRPGCRLHVLPFAITSATNLLRLSRLGFQGGWLSYSTTPISLRNVSGVRILTP